MNTRDLLAAVRTAQQLPSNYALAKLLDVREKDVSRWNTGANTPTDAMVLRLCDLGGLDPAEVLPSIMAERTTDEALRSIWHRVAERASATAAAALLGITFTGGPDAGAAVRTDGTPTNAQGSVCILCQLLRRRLQRFLGGQVLALA